VTLTLLPSTNFRRAILGARVDLPGGRSARFHCTALSAPVSATDLPYTGAYGGGQQGVNGWIAENELQVTKLVARVERAAAGEGAVVLGDFQTGAEYKRGADVVVAAAPAYRSIAQLEAAFAPGVARDWRPECTHCPENPLTPGTPPYRFAQIFLRRGAPGAAIQTERTFTEGVVRGNADELIPRSFDYGLRSQLRF